LKGIIVLIKLILIENLRNRARTLLALLGIAVSVCLVVWVIRGYEATAASTQQARQAASEQPERYDVIVSPKDRTKQFIDPAFLAQIRKDPLVAEIDEAVTSRIRGIDPPIQTLGPFGGASLLGTAAKEAPGELTDGYWLSEDPDVEEAVLSSSFQQRQQLWIGDEITIGGNGGEVTLTVVGTVQTSGGGPAMGRAPMGPSRTADICVRPGIAGRVNGYTDRPNLVSIVLKDKAAIAGFVKTWAEKGVDATPPAAVRSLRRTDSDDPMMGGQMTGMIRVQEMNASFLAFLAAAFIIFTTLNATVRERTRQHAILRAVALSRTQLVFMIALEAILLAAAGWALGLLFAVVFLNAGNSLGAWFPAFRAPVFASHTLGANAVLFSGIAALGAALAAAILPAWQALKVKPIDILSRQEQPAQRRFPWLVVTIGLVLIAVNPLIVYLARFEFVRDLLSHIIGRTGFSPPLIGCVAMIIGFAMITPLVVRLTEALFGPVLARILGIDRRFLRQQLSGNMRRTVGTTIALSTGLALFVTVQVWGYSMLVPFTPDKTLPRMLVTIHPAGLPESAVNEVRNIPGVRPGQCLAMAVEQPKLTDEMLASKPFATVDPQQQHVLIIGVDPQQAFGGSDPVVPASFIQGNIKDAARKLPEGRYCIVPDNFHTQTGLGVGDKFSVAVPDKPGQSVEYTIAGVVAIPGWNWFTKFAEIRQRSGRALALIFTDYNQTKADYGISRISYFWMNTDDAVTPQDMKDRILPIADRNAGVRVNVPSVGETYVAKQYIMITDRFDLTKRLMGRANSIIWSITWFPLIALVITSLAVFNTVLASVRARFWQIGILRGVGLTRSQLFRMILSESLMIFGAAGTLSLISGVLLAWCGTNICTYFFFFAGRTPPIVLPWGTLALGFGIAFALCGIAGLIPAALVAAREPLTFIQKGRLAV